MVEGRRANLIGSYLMAAQDEEGNLKTMAYTATGLGRCHTS